MYSKLIGATPSRTFWLLRPTQETMSKPETEQKRSERNRSSQMNMPRTATASRYSVLYHISVILAHEQLASVSTEMFIK